MEATDQEIFDQATAEQTQNVPETPTEAPTEAKEGRVRDERGRFVSAATEEPERVESVEAPQPEPEKPATKDEDGARVPSWRLAEEADRRRAAEQALNELRNEFQMLRVQMQQPQQPPAPQEVPDIFADPQGFVETLMEQQRREMRQLRLENSLERAHNRHGDTFNEAYQEFTNYVAQTRDQATYQRVMASHDPGAALVQWYKDQSLQKELGGSDLKTFLEKQREEWMKDPAVQAKVIEAFKATQTQPSNLTNLPPSLSRATAARSAHDEGGSSGADMYNYATR